MLINTEWRYKMAEVKWIKIATDIFDDEKMLMIESLPEADSIIVIWFKLLALAGKSNNSGVFMFKDNFPYTDEMLATIFRRKESTVRLALETFQRFGMVEIIDDVITIPNWGKHQDLDQLESRKAYMREYMHEYREKQKQLACKTNDDVNSKVNSKVNVNSLEREEDKNKNENITYQQIVDMYNDTCVSLPKVTTLSDKRKKAIKARLRQYSVDDFRRLFEKAEASNFLKGGNDRDWTANFDWLIKDANMAKTLDGNYDNKGKQVKNKGKPNKFNNFESRDYDFDELERKLTKGG